MADSPFQSLIDKPPYSDAGSRRRLVVGTLLAHPAVTFLVAGAASLAFAASFGLNYGIDNQVIYLLKSLTIVHPDLLRNDCSSTTSPNTTSRLPISAQH